jgi:erythromycin esterase-like protein
MVRAPSGWRTDSIRAVERRAADAIYGSDMYSLSESITAVLRYLDSDDPVAARVARERHGCLGPWQKDPTVHGRAASIAAMLNVRIPSWPQLGELVGSRLDYAAHDGERFLDAIRNARVVAVAERYYRAMYYGGARSWNLRYRPMFETLHRALDSRGPDARAVV